jgi:hypothetical protein
MFEIAAHHHLPILRVFAFAIPAAAIGLLLLYVGNKAQLGRVVARAAVAGVLCAVASAALWSTRGAGTGTQTAWGWPRVVYARWTSWETAERVEGIRWWGFGENTVFYGAAAILVGSLVAVSRRRPRPKYMISPDGHHRHR